MPYMVQKKTTARQPSVRNLNFHFVTIQTTTQPDGLKNQINCNFPLSTTNFQLLTFTNYLFKKTYMTLNALYGSNITTTFNSQNQALPSSFKRFTCDIKAAPNVGFKL